MSNLLDLDAVHADLEDIAIKLNGAVHRLKPLSVIDFIENTELMQKLRVEAGDMKREFEATVTIVARSFPSVALEDLRNLSFIQLNKLVSFARKANGDGAVEEQIKAEAPVVPAAEVASIGSENPPAQ